MVARSFVESEFRVTAQGLCELIWQKIILDDLRIKWDCWIFAIQASPSCLKHLMGSHMDLGPKVWRPKWLLSILGFVL